jgi:monoamine oxidase
MIFDWLKEKSKEQVIPELNISYDIFEASSKERLGGRLYTYKFPSTPDYVSGDHDYYDVGAMRFPENPVMKRTFDLFEYLGIQKKSKVNPGGKLIRYYLKSKDGDKKNPTYYNDIHYVGPPPSTVIDPYDINSQTGDPIPVEILRDGPDKTMNKAIKVYRDAFAENPAKGWSMLMDADRFSARAFLLLPSLKDFETVKGSDLLQAEKGDTNPIGGPGLNFNTVEWLETFKGGTRWFSQAFSEMVLENLDFDYPTEGSKEIDWFCIEGGANILAQEMEKKISVTPQYESPVTSIKLESTADTHSVSVGVKDALLPQKYAAVFNSTTLGAMQRMDLSEARLNYGTKQAIRTLNYGAACKVGIWFSKAWWRQEQFDIQGGLGGSDLPLRVCVYPSYNLDDNPNEPAVLLCSYTWEQDASRLGALISKNSPNDEETLKNILFKNLARLHATDKVPYAKVYDIIASSYITHHAYNWNNDPYASGAFAFFGPSQFKEVWPDLTTPSADGKLFIIGEAASTHHAWVVGALQSALRGVFHFLTRYSELYPEYQKALDYLKNTTEEDGPFLPLPAYISRRLVVPVQVSEVLNGGENAVS